MGVGYSVAMVIVVPDLLPPTPPDAVEKIRLAERAGTIDYLIQKAHDRIDKFLQKR